MMAFPRHVIAALLIIATSALGGNEGIRGHGDDRPPHLIMLTVDPTSSSPLAHLWSRCLGSGHAALTLRADWRDAVKRARAELGLEMVRFHGLLDDDTSVSLGPGQSSWLNVDSTVDFLVGEGMRSVLELSFMPSWLASGPTTSGMQYHPNNTPPKTQTPFPFVG